MDGEPAGVRAAELAQQGENKLQGFVGPIAEAAVSLRKAYLGWHGDGERFLSGTGLVDRAVLDSLRGARRLCHRRFLRARAAESVSALTPLSRSGPDRLVSASTMRNVAGAQWGA